MSEHTDIVRKRTLSVSIRLLFLGGNVASKETNRNQFIRNHQLWNAELFDRESII
jgi:hypothetical protein